MSIGRSPRFVPICLALLLASAAIAGPNTECPEIPPDLTLDVWQPIKLGDVSFRVGLGYVPGGTSEAPSGGTLRIFLFANSVDPATGEPVAGSLRPGLAPGYRVEQGGQETASGPPSSKRRFAAASSPTARAKYAATSSTQIGWMRCRPEPTIGVTGARRASLANVGRMPPSVPKTKDGRKITYGIPDAFTSCSICHFAP